ncbi:GNAT family N-acetyltransferase [Elioraea rosea]|uniref:GNAT family N-acetyltransferase n=1 Tax=Elioraea rosea TaxID=2492390 RepID=UPI00118440DA|nr:GNAT family N-acetyltransferase [Elioraea rosea]
MSGAVIRPFDDIDGAGFTALAEDARQEGHRFLDRMAADWHAGTNRFDRPGEMVIGAWVGETLAGVLGRGIDPHSQDPSVGRLRHLYVRRDMRGRGIGAALARHALADAAQHFRLIRVRMGPDNPGAAAMYNALGFTRVTGNPFATHALPLRDGT